MTTILRGIAIFLLLSVATGVMVQVFDTEFGTINFWQKRGVFFLFFVTLFPRLTLLFSSVATGGIFWWLGFFFTPRLLVAALATISYFNTNPVLVTISWLIALGGEVFEKWGVMNNRRFVFRTYHFRGPGAYHDVRPHSQLDQSDVIEAEFRKSESE